MLRSDGSRSSLFLSLPMEQDSKEIYMLNEVLWEIRYDMREFRRIHPTTYQDDLFYKTLEQRKENLLKWINLRYRTSPGAACLQVHFCNDDEPTTFPSRSASH